MAKPPAPSDVADKFLLRMPDGLRDRLAAAAKANNRSSNAEIVARLQASLDQHEPDNPFLRLAASAQQESLRGLADVLADVVEDLDTIVGPLDGEAWRAGAYSILEDDREQPPGKRYERGTPQHASWVAGRAFAVAAELKKTVRQAQGSPSDQDAEG
jgi:hypothetical protein